MRSFLDFRVLVLRRLRVPEWQSTLLWAGLIGVLGALATIGFRESVMGVERLLFGRSDGLVHIARSLPPWLRLLTPMFGGLIAGLVLTLARKSPEGKGGDYMEAIALGDGDLGVRASCLRALSSAATVASGGAIGREGPMVQLAALTGSLIGRWRSAPVPRRRLMVACGAAAGVATAYNAPIAGALFVAEIVLRSLAMESLGPLLVAAFAANVTAGLLVGTAPVYQMPAFVAPQGGPMILLASVGLVAGLGAPLYLGLLDQAHALFRKLPLPLTLKLGAGGLIVGALSLSTPEVWGNGYSVVNSVLQGQWVWTALLAVLAMKLLAVSATTGSGAVGGIFTPTLFVGAISGALFSIAVQYLWPGVIPESASIAVGMGAFLAACTHSPLMSVLMIFEMTENYGVVVPLMLACVLGYSISRVLRPKSIYAGVPDASAHAPALTMAADLMHTDSATVQQGQSLGELEAAFVRWRRPHIYVLDAERRFVGAIALHDVAPLIKQQLPIGEPWPAAILRADYPRVWASTPIWQVMEVFATHPGERLPVLDGEQRLLGYVTKTDLVLMFRERLAVA